MVFKAMDVCINGQEMSIAILNGLLLQLKNFSTTLDALEDDCKSFN